MAVHMAEGYGDSQAACIKYHMHIFKFRFNAVENGLDLLSHLSISSSHRYLFIGRMGIEV